MVARRSVRRRRRARHSAPALRALLHYVPPRYRRCGFRRTVRAVVQPGNDHACRQERESREDVEVEG